MKKFLVVLLVLLCIVSFSGCYSNNNYTPDTPVTEEVSSKEPTCSEAGHNYDKGICTRCGEIIEVDMNERVSKPTFMEFSLNSADGMKTFWRANNLSGKTVKYCYITFRFENAVGDPAYDEHTGKDNKSYRLTGPFEVNDEFVLSNEIIGYCADCYKIILEEITLEYMDGTQETGYYGWSINEYYSY